MIRERRPQVTMDNHHMPPAGNTREHRKNQILMAVVVIFILLLLVFAILLTVNVVMAIRDRTSADLPNEKNNDDQNEPNEPEEPEQPMQQYKTYSAEAIHEGMLIQVNSSHPYTFPTGESHLVNVSEEQTRAGTKDTYYMLANNNLRLEQTTYQALNKMLIAFSEAGGRSDVQLTTAYRSRKDQDDLNSSTKGGYSEHHTGLTLALNIYSGGKTYSLTSDVAYDWIYQNCYKYGFIARYPAGKSDITGVSNYEECFRYVGYAHAYVMKTENFCLEEYISYLRNYTMDAPLAVTTDDGSNYEIYYVIAENANETQVPVPDTEMYTVSGDNDKGFIVTVKLP